MQEQNDAESSRRDYRQPYTGHHHVPTVKGYRDYKEHQKEELDNTNNDTTSQGGPPMGHEQSLASDPDGHPNRHRDREDEKRKAFQEQVRNDTTQITRDPKQARKDMKHKGNDRAEREVTDPVTHLPITIRDFIDEDLNNFNEQHSGDDSGASKRGISRTASQHSRHSIMGLRTTGKRGIQLQDHQAEGQANHDDLEWTFPPPSFTKAKQGLQLTYTRAIYVGIAAIGLVCPLTFWASGTFVSLAKQDSWSIGGTIGFVIMSSIAAAVCVLVTLGLRQWVEKKFAEIWEDEVWAAQKEQAKRRLHSEMPESTQWFNKLIGSIWPLVNPDLFASLSDMLEDVMQASLPKLVRMVCVEDLGQGSDPLRILGVRWLPKGAASHEVNQEGKLEGVKKGARKHDGTKQDQPGTNDLTKTKANEEEKEANEDASKDANERTDGNEDEQHGSEGQDPSADGGMKPETGDFINLQVAFAYRATHSRKAFKDRAKHAHLYLAFYLPGNIKIPIWVELRGFIGTARMRLQLTPDPPFIQLATITFMGQPKVDISCIPLVKFGPNIMDLPLISNFVQSAVDAALAQYVAPRSLTLDIKSMISGDDFKKDTTARGIVVVRIKRAFDFKAADISIPIIRKGSSDPYVSVGWAKFGKPMWSTRVLEDEMAPYWEEECYLLVGPEELDAEENLRVQLWDSDRSTADDDLGRIELPIKHLMKNENSCGRMWDRVDPFQAMKKGDKMPGRLEWSVGYFTKTRLMDYQVAHRAGKDGIKTVEELKKKSFKQSGRKLREASADESSEVKQLREQDFEDAALDIISTSPPSEDYPSGILSIVVHQIVGLELERQNRPRDEDGGEDLDDEDESSELLPDSYVTIALNDSRIYKTRTKPKSSNPFFNAGTERFIRDWRSTSVLISIRDARVHEDDALLGVVHIPLGRSFTSRQASRFDGYHPIAGGIGYGRVRISVCFRSVQLQLPPNMLGWDYGTLEVSPTMSWLGSEAPSELKGCRIRVRALGGQGKLYANDDRKGYHLHTAPTSSWSEKRQNPIMLPVRNRYSQPLLLEFRGHRRHRLTVPSIDANGQKHNSLSPTAALGTRTQAFAVLWLSSITDEEEQNLELNVWRVDGTGQGSVFQRAQHNVLPGEQCGEKLGVIACQLRFWRGIGVAHKAWAKRSEHLASTLDVLDAAKDEGLIAGLVGDGDWWRKREKGEIGPEGELGSGSSSESSASEDEGNEEDGDLRASRTSRGMDHRNTSGLYASKSSIYNSRTSLDTDTTRPSFESGKSSGGIIDEIKDYARNKKELHRKHRGVMQWKAPRTVEWMKHKAEKAVNKVASKFEHSERQPGIETEA